MLGIYRFWHVGQVVLRADHTEGRQRLATVAPVYLAGIEAHFTGHLSDREIVAMSKALEKVLAAEEGHPGIFR